MAHDDQSLRSPPDTRVNAADDVFERAACHPRHVALSRKVAGDWQPVTSREFADQVTALAAGLADAGIQPGDRVALMSATRYEWTLCDLAVWTTGAVTVPIYETSAPEQIGWILDDCNASGVIVENERDARIVEPTAVPSARHLWQITDGALDRLMAKGTAADAAAVEQRRDSTVATSPATIVYTSGTTGRPKGCVITHGALTAEVRSVCRADALYA